MKPIVRTEGGWHDELSVGNGDPEETWEGGWVGLGGKEREGGREK